MNFNALGLTLNIVGASILFAFGPPQPSFEHGEALGLGSNTPLEGGITVAERDALRDREKNKYRRWSRAALGLIWLGFVFQLIGAFASTVN